jgi:hypothetical protein
MYVTVVWEGDGAAGYDDMPSSKYLNSPAMRIQFAKQIPLHHILWTRASF